MFWYSYAANNPLDLSWTSGVGPGCVLALVGFLGAAALISVIANARRKRTPHLRLVTIGQALESAA